MKKMFLMLMCVVGLSNAAEIPDSMLSPAQKTYIESNQKVEQAKANKEVVSSYIGIGKEVGIAVRESMSAITDETNKLANTKVGAMLVWIIFYKVFGPFVVSVIVTFFQIAFTWVAYFIGFYLFKKYYYDADGEYKQNWALSIALIGTILCLCVTGLCLGSIHI